VRIALRALYLAALAALAAPSGPARAGGAEGSFGLAAMVHTHNWPASAEVLPWDGRSAGSFTYRAIPCSGNAPMNNIGTNLPTYNGLIPGSRSPASTRSHPFAFTVEQGAMRGTIALTVCQLRPGPTTDGRPDAERDRIDIAFTAAADRRTAEETIFSGTFRITGGTGRYAQLTGSGTIRGYFMCFDPRGCEAGNEGRFRDMQYVLEGTFRDPAFAP
jgi:hypothetical protein